MPFIGQQPAHGNRTLLDSITTSATATYTLQSSSATFTAASAESLIVSLNGVIQAPINAYTLASNNTQIVFAEALTSNDVIDFIISVSDAALPIGTPSDSTVSAAKLQTSNAGSNSEFLSKQSGNTGGLTWAEVTPYIDWDTTAKTSNFTAVAGKGYLLDTSSGAVTVTLPASATAGDKINIVDATNSAAINNITIARNGLKIYGGTSDVILSRGRASVGLIYADATNGWIPHSGEDYYTNYSVEVLIVAGGGSGGANKSNGDGTGGGGGGGMQKINSVAIPATGYSIVIGAGAAQNTAYSTGGRGSNGSDSSAFGTTSVGGGAGGGSSVDVAGVAGGSGGGCGDSLGGSGAAGTSGQGNAGGNASSGNPWRGGGGGGAGAVGGDGETSGNGGAGSNTYATWATATSSGADSGYYAGGGGGGVYYSIAGDTTGGAGGGGKGESNNGGDGTTGTTNTGGGGGGGGSNSNAGNGGGGGSGIVIVRYPGSQRGSGGTVATSGGYTYHKFTSSGTYTG